MAATMSSSLVAGAGTGLRGAGTFAAARSSPAVAAALPPRRRALQIVRAAKSDDENKPDPVPTTGEPIKLTAISPENETSKPGLWDVLKFGGPVPERINGRLAMVGFVSALAVEAFRGVDLLSQARGGAGMAWFAYSAVVLSAASLAPLLQGEEVEGWSGGIWNADAELWNGRAAMLGLVALAATEYLTGSPLISSVSV